MKRIIFGLMLAMMFCTLVQGANRTVTENDGQGNKKRVIELRDTVINGETVTDTLSIMTYENGTGSSDAPEKWRTHHSSMDWNGFDLGSKTSETVIAVTAIVFVFGLPLRIIFVVFRLEYRTCHERRSQCDYSHCVRFRLSFNHRSHYLFLPL